jgi:protein deglycase
MKTTVVLLADGFEETEALVPTDYLRRAGIRVVLAGIGGTEIRGSHGIRVLADAKIGDLGADIDCVLVPGGMPGAKNIAESPEAISLIRDVFAKGNLVAAICAAPVVVLANAAGILKEKKFTCFPGMENEADCGNFLEERVISDGNLITSRAAGTAGEFAMAIIARLAGADKAKEVADKVLLKP